MATTQERLDPTSPHYDEEFAELRRKAYKAYDEDKRERPERYEDEGLGRKKMRRGTSK